MSEPSLYELLVWLMLGMAALTFVALQWVTAPYGRHGRSGWGPSIPSRVAWIVMESPAVLVFLAIYMAGQNRGALVPCVLLSMWMIHYVQRTFIFPFRIRS